MPSWSEFQPYIVTGLALGGIYALSGVGLVVLYRATGVLNLAFGAVGAMGAFIAYSIIQAGNPGWVGWITCILTCSNAASIAPHQTAHRRIPRIDGAERSPSGQARCRSCHETIERGSWRVRLVFYEGGRFTPGGYLHLGCRDAYFETHEVMEQILHFSPDLSDEQRQELRRAAASG